MNRFLPVLRTMAPVILIFGLTMSFPLALSHGLADGAATAYAEGMAITAGSGLVLLMLTRRHAGDLQVRDGFLMVTLAWTVLPAFATLPLLLHLPGLGFTDAYFETAAAMTTTGASVLTGLDLLPPSINIWRGMLQWIGGMGVVVLAVAILPPLGVGGRQLFRAETPGPMKDSNLTPRMIETAKGLWTVYVALTALAFLSYKIAGMSWLDALMHAFTTLSLGGYSTHDASYAYFDSSRIEFVAIVFMLIAGINFGTHFLAFRGRSLEAYRADPEVAAYSAVVLGSVLGVAGYLWHAGMYPEFGAALRFAAFNVVSIATTTGYASTDYGAWPIFAPLWMLLLACFASCSGSTGGGVKMIRAQVMSLQALREMRRLLHPSAHIPLRVGRLAVENNAVFAVLAFMLVFGATSIVSTLLLTASGLDVVTAASAAIASVTNTGPGLNGVGPATSYAHLGAAQKWICIATMILGRLELLTVLVVATPGFWRR